MNASQSFCLCQLTPWKQNSLLNDSDCSATIWWDIPLTQPTHTIHLTNSKCRTATMHIQSLHHLETHFAEQQRWIFWLHWFVCSRNCHVSSCALTTLSLVLGALSASTGFPSVESCSTGFQLLQNPAALAWSWKAMLKYTQPYYMPAAAETIFWIWVSAAKDTVTHCSKKCMLLDIMTHCSKKCTLLDIRFSIRQLPNSAQLGPKRCFCWGVPNVPILQFFAQLQKLALHTTKPFFFLLSLSLS